MKEKWLTCSWVLKTIVLRSNYICLSSFTALLRLKRNLYAVCYLPDYPLKHAFIAYEYRCCACHSADEFILIVSIQKFTIVIEESFQLFPLFSFAP